MRITATFLDEITYDIPSNNWGEQEWAEDFRVMKSIGIDTVVLIRGGLRNVAAFPSKALQKHIDLMPVNKDLVDMFLSLAEQNQMAFYFGTYYPDGYLKSTRTQKEIDINKELIEEVWDKYGRRKAFKGWYLTHEVGRREDVAGIESIYQLGKYCKNISPDLPTMISPYVYGKKIASNPVTLEQHREEWDEILARFKGVVDIVCFQDGQTDFSKLLDYLLVNNELIRKYGMTAWSNIETFDRDMPIRFPPIDWCKLLWKLNYIKEAGCEKLITFEFSHFLSPNSQWVSSKNLFNRYCEHFGIILGEKADEQKKKHIISSQYPVANSKLPQPRIAGLKPKML